MFKCYIQAIIWVIADKASEKIKALHDLIYKRNHK